MRLFFKIKLIKKNKLMLLTSVTGQESFEFDVDKNAQSITLTNLKATSTIRIDEEGKSLRPRNVFPEMTVREMVSLMLAVNPTQAIINYNSTDDVFTSIVIYFSVNGMLPFSKDFYYKVKLGSLLNRTIQIYRQDSIAYGFPLTVKKHDFKDDQPEFDFKVKDSELLFFPMEDMFDRISYIVNDQRNNSKEPSFRKVEITQRTLFDSNNTLKSSLYDSVTKITEYGLINGVSFNVSNLNLITIYDPSAEADYVFTVDFKNN